LVGAEGFEGSFPSDRYAVFFVRFSCKSTQFEGFARILRRTFQFQIFSPMDKFLQDFRITSYHLIASKIVQLSVKVGAEGVCPSRPKKGLNASSGLSASELHPF
jgi:hypothetical protein